MWALQSNQLTLNWQFDFTHQLDHAAVEANWQLAINPRAAGNIDILLAAAFAPEKRYTPPGAWALGSYGGVDFHTVLLAAADQCESANNEQMDEMLRLEELKRQNRSPVPVHEFDLADMFNLFDTIHASNDATDDATDDGRPAGMQPAYRDGEPAEQAEAQEADLVVEQHRRRRNRFVCDEVEEADGDSDGSGMGDGDGP